MKECKKGFLILVGLATIAFDELISAVEEAVKSIEDQRRGIKDRITKTEAE